MCSDTVPPCKDVSIHSVLPDFSVDVVLEIFFVVTDVEDDFIGFETLCAEASAETNDEVDAETDDGAEGDV